MTAAEIELLVNGRHGDAFSALGPHLVKAVGEESHWEVRAYLPEAESAEVVLATGAEAMRKKHPGGFFSVLLKKEPAAYRLRVTRYDGSVQEIEDPYRFPPQLTDFEIYLHGEGTNFETYSSLGAHLVESEGQSGVRFAVWAPNAESVALLGDFNQWDT